MRRLHLCLVATLLALLSLFPCFFSEARAADKNAELASAVACFNKKDYKTALSHCNKAIKANPSDIGAHYYKALSLHYMNQISQAKQEYEWVSKTGNNRLAVNAQKALSNLSGYKSQYSGSGVNPSSYASHGGRRPKVLDFYTTWCGPCKRLAPILGEVERSYHGKVDFERLDAEASQNQTLVKKYKINAYPTLIFLDRNGQEADRMRGVPGGGKPGVIQALSRTIDGLLK